MAKGESWESMFKACVAELEAGTMTLPPMTPFTGLRSDSPTCHGCAVEVRVVAARWWVVDFNLTLFFSQAAQALGTGVPAPHYHSGFAAYV